MGKILGLDLGTNSIGIAVRNEDIDGKLVDQLEYYSSVVFKSGVGKEKTGELNARTSGNIIVELDGSSELTGTFQNVKITKARNWILKGELCK